MSKRYFDPNYESRLSHEEDANRVSVAKLLRAIRKNDGRGPEVQLLPDGRNVIVVDFEVTPQLARQGYITRAR